MTASTRNRSGLKPLAGLLFPLSLVLALLALEEPTALAIWGRASQTASDAIEAIRGAAPAPAPRAVHGVAQPSLQGVLNAADQTTRQATGDVEFRWAELRFQAGGVLATRPYRIAHGREFAADPQLADAFGRTPEAQVELREVLAASTARLCPGGAPAWIGLQGVGPQVTVVAFAAGPPPGGSVSTEAPCAVLTYRR